MRQNRNLTRWLPAALCGIALAGIANFNSSLYGQVTNLVALTSFEPAVFDENFNLLEPDTMPRYPWAYRYIGGPEGWDPNTPPTLETQYGIPETDPNPTNHCERVYFYTYAYSPLPTGNSYGLGFGGGMNWNRFDPAVVKMSTNRADYIMSFDAKVEGLLPEFNDISIEMQVQMDAPDDTIEPADSNGDADRIIGINKAVNVTSNWTHFQYLLEDANIDGGTPLANLVKYGNLVNSVNYNVNVHMPSDRFGFDWDNYVYIDNIKLQVINDTNPPPPIPPTTPITMLEWNMDDKPMWGAGWGGYNWSANTNLPIFTYNVSAAGYGVGGSNGWYLAMDNRTLAAPNTPAWAGGGTGCNGPVDLTRFDTGDLKGYRLTFDSRAEGLNVNRTTPTTIRLQLFLDSSLGNAGNSRLDFNIPAGSNWVTTTYILSDGAFGTGSKSAFATNYNTLTGVHLQMQIENANSEGDWGFDNDNVVVIDNIKLERLVVACPPLTVTVSGNNTVVKWPAPNTGTAKLQSAAAITGPWSDVAGATSPYSVPTASAPKFFRTLWVPPTQ